MSSVVISGDTSGAITLAAPAVAGTTTLTLPATTGTVLNDATVGVCRAWVNFNGTTNVGGFCTIRASFNVTSVTDNGTGDYTVNFTTAMPDTSYAGIGSNGTDVASGLLEVSSTGKTVSAQKVISKNGTNNTVADQSLISVAVFR